MPHDELKAVLIKQQHNVMSANINYPLTLWPIAHEYVLLWRRPKTLVTGPRTHKTSVQLTELTDQEAKLVHAARAYGDALAVLRGTPPFSAWDAARIAATERLVLVEAAALAGERAVGASIPDHAHAPPDLMLLMKRFLLPGKGSSGPERE